MPEHGGRLIVAARRYSIPLDQWLDLSTGINPNGWPVPPIPSWCWQRLPDPDDGLIAAAKAYYGCRSLLPVAGSQAAIQCLPRLRSPCRVAVQYPGYSEHRIAWQQHGHEVVSLDFGAIVERIEELDVVVIINPNNPTGEIHPPECMLALLEQLEGRGGWLIVDEAFMDMTPDRSVCAQVGYPGLIVLRSIGKFFGLAGLRLGFVCAWSALLQEMARLQGPWAIATPSRWIGQQALVDHQWQTWMRAQLYSHSEKLNDLLYRALEIDPVGTALFKTCRLTIAKEVHEHLAHQGILVRLLDDERGIRFGLPADEKAFVRLKKALSTLGQNVYN